MRIIFYLLLFITTSGCTFSEVELVNTNQTQTKPKPAVVKIDESGNEEIALKKFESLKADFERSFAAFEKKIRETENDTERKAIFEEQNPVVALMNGLEEIANNFEDTKAGFDAALEYVSRAKGVEKDKAMQLLITKYATKLEYKKVIQSLLDDLPSESIENWLRLMVVNAPNEESTAIAKLGFARYVNQIPAFRDGFEKNPLVLSKLPQGHQQYLTRDRTENEIEQVAEYLKSVISDAPEGHYRRGRSFKEFADSALFELENLAVGKVAPEIVGNDLDGIEFKLSDYRGKVVMLDFWGHWCGPCRRMYPQEREMVEQLASTPFALIGMNSDSDLEFAKEAVESEGLSWRHFWNGPKGTMGPISARWNVEAWPTVYLIDGSGVIRYKNLLGDDLDRAIETLLAEMGHEIQLGP